jgi:hypothetical protein
MPRKSVAELVCACNRYSTLITLVMLAALPALSGPPAADDEPPRALVVLEEHEPQTSWPLLSRTMSEVRLGGQKPRSKTWAPEVLAGWTGLEGEAGCRALHASLATLARRPKAVGRGP